MVNSDIYNGKNILATIDGALQRGSLQADSCSMFIITNIV